MKSPRFSEGGNTVISPQPTSRETDSTAVGKSIASGYKAMATQGFLARVSSRKALVEQTSGEDPSKTNGDRPVLAPINAINSPRAMRDALALNRNASNGALTSMFRETMRQNLSEEMERKLHDLEELIRKTKLMCMESLSEEAFKDIYDFFQTNVTSKDNMLNDQQLADLERIVMSACGNNIQKSYVVLFNVQKLLAQEDKLRELKNLIAEKRILASSDSDSTLSDSPSAPSTPAAEEGQRT